MGAMRLKTKRAIRDRIGRSKSRCDVSMFCVEKEGEEKRGSSGRRVKPAEFGQGSSSPFPQYFPSQTA